MIPSRKKDVCDIIITDYELNAHLTARNVPPPPIDAGKSTFCCNFRMALNPFAFAFALRFFFDFLGEVDTLTAVSVDVLCSGRLYTKRAWVVAKTS